MRTHYDGNNDHIDFMEDVLDPDDIDHLGNRYADFEAYEQSQNNRTVPDFGNENSF